MKGLTVYYIAEVTHQTKRVVDEDQDLKYAEKKAKRHSLRAGIRVEILDELFRTVKQVEEWRE